MSTDSTKEKIENAAKKLFAEKGFDSVTTRQISKEAGVSHSALNYHFKSKELLLLRLSEQFVQAQEKTVFSALPEVSSLAEFKIRIEIFLEALITSLFQDLQLFQLFHNEMERRNPVLVEALDNPSVTLIPKLIRYFKQAQKKGFLDTEIDAQMAALIIFKEALHAVRLDDFKHELLVPGSLRKEAYRQKWIKNLLRIVFGGIEGTQNESASHESRKK